MLSSFLLTTPCKSEKAQRQKKYTLRTIFRSAALLFLIGGYCIYNKYTYGTYYNQQPTRSDNGLRKLRIGASGIDISVNKFHGRRLQEDSNADTEVTDESNCGEKAEPTWTIVFYILLVLYMFLALAIVCDEFFVPALEEMASDRRMGLSMDVAGATLMAAGGSAPELFTSIIGTFQESDIGFGTIVGSAVFNVLFVIAMCSFLSKGILELTWWPLFRDCVYYTFGLVMLSVFIAVISPNEIELWEAVVLFTMYIGYVVMMKYHLHIYKWIWCSLLGKSLPSNQDDLDHAAGTSAVSLTADGQTAHIHFNRHSTFRAGILKLISDPQSWLYTAGVGLVAKIAGDVGEVFAKIDANGDGYLSLDELRVLFDELHLPISEDELRKMLKELDTNNDGKVDENEFTQWYARSERRMLGQIRQTFDKFDVDKSNSIDKSELKDLLQVLVPQITDNELDEAMREMYQYGDTDQIYYEEFEEWYKKSLFYESTKNEIEDELETVCDSLKPPVGEGIYSMVRWVVLLPLVGALTITIPDATKPQYAKYCYLAFVLSICWIGFFSYFMVWGTEIIGATIGIPSLVMGLTFLAAGTSVPDLLSSVIVARMGEGDMAVSSSIGSNIFDILVGLPFPWILFTAWPTTASTISISSDGVGTNIVILLGMLISIVIIIHMQGWKMTNMTGLFMLFLYAGFLVQAVLRELPFGDC